MATAQTAARPAATSQTKPNNQGQVTQAQVTPKRKVTYVFEADSSKNLNIPYAVAVNGKAQAAFDAKPKRVRGSGGEVVAFVDQGDKVSLFLNSDAHPSYRKNAVYEVTAGERDVRITITEKAGKHSDADTPVRKKDKDEKAEGAKAADEYTAPLTGDIWMKVSHKYTAAEVDALLPAGTRPEVVAAVKSIYSGLKTSSLSIAVPATKDTTASTLSVTFSDSNNPKNNIVSYSLLADGLPRAHPAGYAALFSAALDHGIPKIRLTSCWRPLLGSIAHRAGLGLDVDTLGEVTMNREELRVGKGNGNDGDNVSDTEVQRFKEYEDAIVATKKARQERKAAEDALKKPGLKGDEKAKAAQRLETANDALEDAQEAESKAAGTWSKERDASEPAKVKLYRTTLLQCSCIAQLFDPWFMDDNTHDKQQPQPNMQRGAKMSNERLHAHHLHVTVHEPKIL